MTTRATQRFTGVRGLVYGIHLIGMVLCSLALARAHNIELEWDASVSPEVTGYWIYCAKDGQPPERLSAGNATTFALMGLEPGATYTLYATAYDDTGRESLPSNTLSYTVPFPPPSDPDGVPFTSFTQVQSGSVRMNWDSVPGTAYRVLFKDDLSEPVWRVLEAELLAGGESMYFVDRSAAEAPRRFYRLQMIAE